MSRAKNFFKKLADAIGFELPSIDITPEREQEVIDMVGASDMSLSRWEKEIDENGEPLFPLRLRIGRNRVAWRLSEILNWIKRRQEESKSRHAEYQAEHERRPTSDEPCDD